jgi:putative ABC transport system permease protein
MIADLAARGRAWIARVGELFRRRRLGQELDDEIRHHLELEIEYNAAHGMSPDEARRAALVSFGGVQRVREEARATRGFFALDALARDVRYAWRSLRLARGFTFTAVATIALGIATVTSVFGFVNAIFLRPLVPAAGGRVVRVFFDDRGPGENSFSHAAVRELAHRARSFDLVGEHYSTAPLYVTASGWRSEIQGAVVSADYFRVLGAAASIGRFFTPDEDSVPDRDAVAVIGDALWRTRFGADSAILRQTIGINGRTFTIIGVAPPGFFGAEPDRSVVQLWIPTSMFRVGYRWCDALAAAPPCAMSHIVARLAEGATLKTARTEVSTMQRELIALTDRADSLERIAVEPALGFSPVARQSYDPLARLLWAISIVLLAIACINLAGLLLVRGLARRHEIALRLAIGAGRLQVTRQLVIECVLLGVLGGVAGLVLSTLGAAELASFFTVDNEGYRHALEVHVDARVLLFAMASSLAAVVLFGTVPALASTRANLVDDLREGARSSDAKSNTRHVLVAAQITLAVILLIGAALLSRSVGNLLSTRRFDAEHVALMRLRPRLVGYEPAKAERYLADVVRQFERTPGVESAALARGIGLVWYPQARRPIALPSTIVANTAQAGEGPQTVFTTVTPGFFSTLGISLTSGRDFTDHDRPGTPPVLIVNEALASTYWPGVSPIGRTVSISEKAFTVVGVVPNFRIRVGAEPDVPIAFAAFWQNVVEPEVDARIAIKVRGDPAAMLNALARAAQDVDASVPVTELLTMTEQVTSTFSSIRLARAVLTGTGALALLLSAIGLYGVVAFVVRRRTREIGVRMAIGARRGEIVRLFVGQNLRWALIGILIGGMSALAATRVIAAWLVGVSPSDPTSFVIAVGAVLIACVLGTLLPAWQAGRVDPVVALRSE